jgi:hypothetical protein
MILPDRGFAQFNKACSQVTQRCGMAMKALEQMIVPVSTATLLNP